MSTTRTQYQAEHDSYLEDATCDIDNLNTLLRGELSAVESYDQAMKKFEGQPMCEHLRRIRNDHRESVNFLESRIRRYDGQPVETSGPWGAFTAVVTTAIGLAGRGALLAALKRGEEHGIGAYEDALGNSEITEECKTAIRVRLLPQVREHVVELERLIDVNHDVA